MDRAGDAPLFAACAQDERDALSAMAVPLRVKAGEDIVAQGSFGSTIGVILEGSATVVQDGAQIAELGPGDCYGELAAMENPGASGHRTASVRATTEVRADTFTAADLNRELSSLPGVAAALHALRASHQDDPDPT